MNIVVCLKQVPKKDSILRISADQKWIDERDISYEMSEADAYALEEALRQKEKHGGEVIVISLGPERVRQSIKEALAKGADRAIHLSDPLFEAATDAPAVSRALAAALKDEKYDLILTGLQSDDYGFAQVGLILAEHLGLASATIAMEVQPEAGSVRVKRELESGWFQWVKVPMPAVLTIQSGINQLRYATLKGIMAAKEKEIREVKAADLGLTADDLKPTQIIERAYLPEKTKRTEMIEGRPAEAAAKLVEKLRFDARVI
ncbi:MAG TPA: electron transfer flavoprotein subunit beta/FixA family protein [Blastocatellia bacterium]|jgi:electron transfer flavoprotein beta subunit|nr:electron transfer flavoprotein subunit beta/FixA family protein [Blastocatellia bacterium]